MARLERLFPVKFPMSKMSKIFLAAVFGECLALFVLGIAYVALDTTTFVRACIGYATSVCIAIFAIDSVLTENAFQLKLFLVLSMLMTVLLLVHLMRRAEASASPVQLAVMAIGLTVACAGEIFFIAVTVGIPNNISQAFGYYHFRMVSASRVVQEMYREYQGFVTLIKLDALVGVAWLLLVLENSRDVLQASSLVSVGFLALSLVWLGLTWRTVYNEDGSSLHLLISLSWVQPAYAAYMCVVVEGDYDLGDSRTAGACVILVRILLVIGCLKMSQTLHKGLLEIHRQIQAKRAELSLTPVDGEDFGFYGSGGLPDSDSEDNALISPPRHNELGSMGLYDTFEEDSW